MHLFERYTDRYILRTRKIRFGNGLELLEGRTFIVAQTDTIDACARRGGPQPHERI